MKRKYEGLHDRQSAYHKTEKGQAAIKKSEAREERLKAKRQWWQENRGKDKRDRRAEFQVEYGDAPLERLTEQENQVLELWLDGATFATIGEQLGFSRQRAQQIQKSALNKLKI